MRKVDLSGSPGDAGAASGLTPRTKRLLILLLVVAILGAGAFAAQKFLLQEKPSAPAPARPLAQAPPAVPKPLVTPPETSQQTPVAPPSTSAPSPPIAAPSPAKEEPKVLKLPEPKSTAPETEKIEKRQAPPKHMYSIQVVSCVEEKNARSLMKDLQGQGFSAKLIKKGKATLTKHSVYLGDFPSKEEASEMEARLQADGIRATLEPMGMGHYSFLVSSSFVLNDAIDIAHELQKKDYSARIHSAQVQAPVYQVFVGRFSERTQTAKSMQRLQEMGYSPIVVRE